MRAGDGIRRLALPQPPPIPKSPTLTPKAPTKGAFAMRAGDGNRTRTVSLGS